MHNVFCIQIAIAARRNLAIFFIHQNKIGDPPFPPHYYILGFTTGGFFKSCPRVPKLYKRTYVTKIEGFHIPNKFGELPPTFPPHHAIFGQTTVIIGFQNFA